MRLPLYSALIIISFSTSLMAQVDWTGEWGVRFHEDYVERIEGPEIGDYLGLPINEAARLRAESWNAAIHSLPEWQCRPHPSDYGTRGPADLSVWKEVDTATQQLIAYHTHVQWQAQERTIWMDGRPHPPEDAPHTWQGFSTGKWEGNMLTVLTSHLKESYLRRNGAPRSDRATLIEHWIRHGDVLTLVSIVDDPVYLTEPLIRTTNWGFNLEQKIDPYPCEVAEETDRPKGAVPHHLPGTNPFLKELPENLKIPAAATSGGKATASPDYIAKLRQGNPEVDVSPRTAPPITVAITQLPAGEIHTQKVRGNVYMLYGAGGNITVQAGAEGVLLVDAGLAQMTDKVVAAIRQISNKPIYYIVNTHLHPDHIGGNEKIAKLGETIAGGDVAMLTADSTEGAKVIAHENVLRRLTASSVQPPTPFGMLPTDTYRGEKKDLYVNDEGIRIQHPKNAHTDGDSIVFFRRSDVLSTGDIFTTTGYPFIDLERGGSIQGEIDALNEILDIVITARNEESGTLIIPGHGRLCDAADVAYYRDMLTIIRDRILDMKKRSMTVEQVVAAKPTRDYDPRWGSTSGFWTTNMFVEAVYKSLGNGR